jgi:tetratricopeptide (TPR) repeat protein
LIFIVLLILFLILVFIFISILNAHQVSSSKTMRWPRSHLPFISLSPRLLVCLFVVAAGAGAAYFWYGRIGPEPPAVASEGVEPAVRDAIEEARATVLHSPRTAVAWGRLGMVLLAHAFPLEAEKCFARAEQLDPREPRWSYYLGVAVSTRDPEAAIAAWQRAALLCGDQPDGPRLRLAGAMLAQGHYDQARSHYQRLLEHEPSHPLAHLGLARLAYAEEKWSDSQAHLLHCTGSPYSRKAAHTLLATVYQRLGEQGAADRELRLLPSLPDDADWPNPFAEELARLRVDRRGRLQQAARLLDQNRIGEGIAALRRLVRDCPDLDAAWRALGYTLSQQGDYAAAEVALQRALQLAPDSAEAQYYMGCAKFSRKTYALAAGYFRRATELKPDYALAHYNLGQCLKLQGDRAGALAAFQAAVDCRPYLAEAHRSLGELLVQDGRKTEALDHLRQAADLNPEDKEARRLLQQLQASLPPKEHR